MEPVEGYNGYFVTREGRVIGKYGRELRQHPNRHGYLAVQLYLPGQSRKTVRVHRLVAQSFLGCRDQEINHKDGDKANNHVDNLELTDRSGNTRHAYRTGLNFKKVSEAAAKDIRRLLKQGQTQRAVADLFGVSQSLVSQINTRKVKAYV